VALRSRKCIAEVGERLEREQGVYSQIRSGDPPKLMSASLRKRPTCCRAGNGAMGHKRTSTPSPCRRGRWATSSGQVGDLRQHRPRAFDRESGLRKPRTIELARPLGVTAGLPAGSAIARRDVAIWQYLIDANIRPMLLPTVVFWTRARHNLRVEK